MLRVHIASLRHPPRARPHAGDRPQKRPTRGGLREDLGYAVVTTAAWRRLKIPDLTDRDRRALPSVDARPYVVKHLELLDILHGSESAAAVRQLRPQR